MNLSPHDWEATFLITHLFKAHEYVELSSQIPSVLTCYLKSQQFSFTHPYTLLIALGKLQTHIAPVGTSL